MEKNKNTLELIGSAIKKYIEQLKTEITIDSKNKMKFLYWDNIEQFGFGVAGEYSNSLVKIHLEYHNKSRQANKRICSLLINNKEISFVSFATGEDILCSQELGMFLDKNFEPITGKELFNAHFLKANPTDIKIWKSFKLLVLDKVKTKYFLKK